MKVPAEFRQVVIVAVLVTALAPVMFPARAARPEYKELKWTVHGDSRWTMIYVSEDGRWQIEPAQNNEGGEREEGKDWALIDLKDEKAGWVTIGTECEMKAWAAHLAWVEADLAATDREAEEGERRNREHPHANKR